MHVTHPRRPARTRGSTLVVSLMLCIAGTVGMVGMLTLIGSRSVFVEHSELAIQRRIALWNSRALAKEFLLGGPILTGSSDETVLDIGSEWGSVVVPPVVLLPLESTQEFAPKNRLGPGGTGSFTSDIELTISNGGIEIPYLLQMKSRSSFFSGDLLSLHRLENGNSGAVDVNGDMDVEGRTVFWDNSSLSLTSFRTASFEYADIIGVTVADNEGMAQPASNFPSYHRTSGPSNGIPGLNGQFNHLFGTGPNTLDYKMDLSGVAIAVNGNNTLNISGVTSDGAGTVTIDLKNHALSQVRVGADVNNLILIGQADLTEYNAASALSHVSILIDSSSSLPDNFLNLIHCIGDNSRPVVLGIHRQTAAAFSNLSMLLDRSVGLQNRWRMLITAQNSPLLFDVTGGHTVGTIAGGIRTDREVTVTAGDGLKLIGDDAPGFLEHMDSREAWIEIYSQL